MHTRSVGRWLFAAHVAVAMACRLAGVRMTNGEAWADWDWFWQTLPMADLRADLTGSIWYLHAQPPLLNLVGGLLGKLFGDGHLEALGWLYLLLGGGIVVLAHRVVLRATARPRLALAVGIAMAVFPCLVLYECYALYTLPSAFLVLWTVERCGAVRDGGPGAPLASLGALAALMLLRSVYHVALFAVALPLVCIASRARWRTVLALGLAIAAPVVGWYGKNLAQCGSFCASTWSGFGLYKIAAGGVPHDELARLGPMFAALPPFEPPSRYVEYGFDRHSAIATLSHDDLHNINVPAIARAYGAAAVRLVYADPARYLRRVGEAWSLFCSPSSRYKHVLPLARRLGWFADGYVAVVTLLGTIGAGGSIWSVLLPAALLLHLALAAATCRSSRARWLAHVREHPADWMAALLIAYTTAVCCTVEYGENDRFKFMIEPTLMVFVVLVAARAAALWRAARTLGGARVPTLST